MAWPVIYCLSTCCIILRAIIYNQLTLEGTGDLLKWNNYLGPSLLVDVRTLLQQQSDHCLWPMARIHGCRLQSVAVAPSLCNDVRGALQQQSDDRLVALRRSVIQYGCVIFVFDPCSTKWVSLGLKPRSTDVSTEIFGLWVGSNISRVQIDPSRSALDQISSRVRSRSVCDVYRCGRAIYSKFEPEEMSVDSPVGSI